MRRISVDTLGMTSPRGATFSTAKRRRNPWYLSRPRLLTTFCFFLALYYWFNVGSDPVLIPEDSFELLQDDSMSDILNTTLGFQKILVLNLPFRTDRRDAITLAAATSNMKLEFVDGVTGDSIKQSAYPPPDENIKLPAGIKGSWRTHMNALQRIVEQNLTTALILEDDVDWDIRVRANLQRYALASRFLSTNHDVLSTTQKYPIEYRPNTETPETTFHILSDNGITEKLPSIPLSSIYTRPQRSPSSSNSLSSPYGDPSQWDVLWFGHCGAGFPRYTPHSPSKHDVTTANVILTLPNDSTVPTGRHLKAHPFQGDLDPLASAYANHTRIYHRASGGELCTVGYAVSQRGARRLLHQFGIKGWNGIFDSELGRWCAGEDEKEKEAAKAAEGSKLSASTADGKGKAQGKEFEKEKETKARERVCLATQPPIFAHHHPQNGESDIGGLGGGYARRYETKYLRYSVRMNLEKIVLGAGERELEDQWPDEEPLED